MYPTDTTAVATTADTGAILGALATVWVLLLVVGIIMLVTMWKVFVKAGKPGWAAIVPIYNIIVLLEIVGRPLWWVLLLFVPIANIVVEIIIMLDLAKAFGKSTVFAIFGLILFPYVGWPMLAFGSAQYNGAAPVSAETPAAV